MTIKAASRVVELPYVGVVLVVRDDGIVETVAGVDFVEIRKVPLPRMRSVFGTLSKSFTPGP